MGGDVALQGCRFGSAIYHMFGPQKVYVMDLGHCSDRDNRGGSALNLESGPLWKHAWNVGPLQVLCLEYVREIGASVGSLWVVLSRLMAHHLVKWNQARDIGPNGHPVLHAGTGFGSQGIRDTLPLG